MEKMTFTVIFQDELTRKDKKGLSTLYLYYLENGKPNTFDLPLFVGDDGKGVLSLECFKRVFCAFQKKIGYEFTATIKSGSDGEESSYNVVSIEKTTKEIDDNSFLSVAYTSPKKSDMKRESSKKTEEKAKAKKADAAKKEAETNDAWNKKAVCEISKIITRHLKANNSQLRLIEDEILKLLDTLK